MLFEAMQPLLQGIGEEKLRDLFGGAVDFLQKIQDETLDQDLLHSTRDTPDAVRNRLIAELFGFPIGPQSCKERCSGKGPMEATKKKPTEEAAVRPKSDGFSPQYDPQEVNDEVLKKQSGSSMETLEDVRARVFGRKRCAVPGNRSSTNPSGQNIEVIPEETNAANKTGEDRHHSLPDVEVKPQQEEASPTAEVKSCESAANEIAYEWKFPVESWCDPKDAGVTVTDSIIRLNICKKEINPETKVSTLKTLEFSVSLPEDAIVDRISASFVEENGAFILSVPKKRSRDEGSSRPLRINFLRS